MAVSAIAAGASTLPYSPTAERLLPAPFALTGAPIYTQPLADFDTGVGQVAFSPDLALLGRFDYRSPVVIWMGQPAGGIDDSGPVWEPNAPPVPHNPLLPPVATPEPGGFWFMLSWTVCVGILARVLWRSK